MSQRDRPRFHAHQRFKCLVGKSPDKRGDAQVIHGSGQLAVTATQYPDDQVVWFLCHRCKHTWCELPEGEPRMSKPQD